MGTSSTERRERDRTFAGGGEMGALVRAHDWAATPLGPAAAWPQSLRTALGILLDNHYPMYIAWGWEYVQFYNDAYRPILGSKHPGALGRGTPESFAEIWDFVRPIFERVMTEGEPTYLEDQLLPLDRHGFVEECYFTYCDSAIRDESGGVGGVLVTIIETTERVLGERRLRTLRDLGAAATEAKTPEDACATAAGILAGNGLDLPFSILYLLDEGGARARRVGLTGLPPEHAAAPAGVALDGADAGGWPLAGVAADGVAREVDAWERFGVLDCGAWPEKPRSAVVLPVGRAGQERPAAVLVAGISGRLALDDGYRDFLRNVADRIATAISSARAHEEERRRAEALAELDRAKTAFFSNVSHEFRTPLTLMLGPLEQLREEAGAALAAPGRELLDTAHRNGLRLLKLVNTLLDFARIEAGRVEVAFEPVELAALTAELASVFRSAVERAGLRLAVDCPPLPEPVFVDTEMWEKIVLNLLSNALKFTFRGEIAVALRPAGERVELEVRDTGVGIAPEQLPQVFQRFHRVRGARSRSHEGSGIGLALVDDLVRLHGGSVRVESTVDVGTTMTVSIPRGSAHLPPERIGAARRLASTGVGAAAFVEEASRWLPETPEEAPVLPAAPPAAGTPGAAAEGAGGRILVADDNADMRGYIARLLAPPYEVETCADGRAALDAVRRRRPDLVLSDVMMPGMDGFQLLRELRAGPGTGTLPVILLSARAGEEATLEGLAAGADDYLIKPFSARELRARVGAQLAMARLRLQLAAAEERNRIARELHDSVTQTLIAATVMAERLAKPSHGRPDEPAGELRDLARMTRGAMAEMRVLLTEMRPELVERTRIGHLVGQLADAVRGRLQMDVSARVEDRDSERLPGEVRTAVYRVAQESLNNVVRHSAARAVEIAVEATPETVDLRIRDDGVGFAPGAAPAGIGVSSMRERAAGIGAALRIHGRPGGGTEVALRWPAPAAGEPWADDAEAGPLVVLA
ncbi:MAG TPA: ATP-binding protein [Longimicrobiaceae bacterium]|jgi:signal transduction histidine kinase